MAKEELILFEGEVVEALPGATFRVRLDRYDSVCLAAVCGKMRKHYVKVLPGDRVRVEVSPYDLSRGRIIYRHRS